MPFYEYECQACKYYTEVMQKVSDAPLVKCPSCGKRSLKKLVSAPVFRLKGSGWYETDFKSDKENKRNLVGQEKEEAKADTKPEAKETKPEAKEAKESKEAKPAEAKSTDKAASRDTPAKKASSARRRSARPTPRGGRKSRR
jgi:putative FmdB family regulatory protein